ncbi:MAG TPA: hypothetical protein VFG69_11745 [Nannocystaceae bacterium]|nr:hypothetical protein [Nannocystaceae bacterium]
MIRSVLFASAVVGCTSTTAPSPTPSPTSTLLRVAEVSPPARPASSITITARRQMFTTSSPPSHVAFDITNSGDTGVVEIVALELVDDAGDTPLTIGSVRLDDTVLAARLASIGTGTRTLDLAFDRTALPRGRQHYDFRLRAKVHGDEIAVEATLARGYRHPIRY